MNLRPRSRVVPSRIRDQDGFRQKRVNGRRDNCITQGLQHTPEPLKAGVTTPALTLRCPAITNLASVLAVPVQIVESTVRRIAPRTLLLVASQDVTRPRYVAPRCPAIIASP